jgi:MGT family glycosyltransferase
MKIIFAATPIGGHVNPLLGTMQFLTQSGHDVVGYTGSTLRDSVERTGATFRPLPSDVDFDLRDIDKGFPDRASYAPGIERMFYDFKTFFLGTMESQYVGLEQLVDDFDADMVVYEHLFYGAVPLLLKERSARPAMIGWGITYLNTPRQDGAPHGPALPFATDEVTRTIYADDAFPGATAALAPIQELYDTFLRGLGFQNHASHFGNSTTLLADAFCQTTVPSFEYPQDQDSSITFVGAAPQMRSTTPLPYWADELENFSRVVLVTQGTVANEDFGALVAPSLTALAGEPDTLVLVTTGGRAVTDFPVDLPANARIAAYLPFDWLLPKINLLITNGGYGTVNQALAVGVPIIVAGATEDKPEVAARIAWAGVGIDLKTATPTAEAIRDAVTQIFENQEFAKCSAGIASEFQNYDSPAIFMQTLDRVAESRVDSESV